MKMYEVTSSQPKNDELLTYLKDSSQLIAIWPLFIRYMVYKTDGEGIEELTKVSGVGLAEEEFEDEYENAIDLDPSIFHKIDPQLIAEFKKECEKELEELHNMSNTSSSFKLIRKTLLPIDTVLIHYTDRPESIAKNGFTRGFPYISMLGETVRSGLSNTVGYNFAYLDDDENHSFQRGAFKKSGYVKFKSSGVYVHHYGDSDNQVIFWGGYVKPSDVFDWGYID